MARAKARQAMMAKTRGSLGKLEDISVRLAGRIDVQSSDGQLVVYH